MFFFKFINLIIIRRTKTTIIILPLKSNLCLFFKIIDIFLKFLNSDNNNINYNKNNKIYNT